MLVTLFLFALAMMLNSHQFADGTYAQSWITLCSLAAVATVTASLLAFFVGLSGEQREYFWKRIHLAVARASA
jgi:hypothetical protein